MEKDSVRQEQAFLALLQEVQKQARLQGGRITRGEIAEAFAGFGLERDQMDQVEAYLKAHKIIVGGEAGDLDALPEGERDFLMSYQEILADMEKLPDNVLEAVKISAMAGDRDAQRRLSEQMLASVLDIARLYAGQGVGVEELVSAGNEALVTGVALLGHLEEPGEVEGELGRRVMDAMEDLVSSMLDENAFDRELEDLANLVADRARDLAREMGRKVSPAELAREGDVTSAQIADAARITGFQIEDLE